MYIVYILECNNGSFYTGITNNIDKRLETHNLKKGSKYVRAHLPFKLVYKQILESKNSALKRELEIKKLSHLNKLDIINSSINSYTS